jgi:LysR family transcriptional regulator, glycine cleavage system transcriptional activator
MLEYNGQQSRQLPPLSAIKAFEAAGRHGSFTGAAQELQVTPAAISHHVKMLEGWLGVVLFRRFARGLELTDDGRRYLPRLTSALDEIASVTDDLVSERTGHARPGSPL